MNETELSAAVHRMRQIGSDTDDLEAKTCSIRLSKDVWESVSAFANTNGGTLLLGLSEKDSFAPVPDFDAQIILDEFVSGMGDGGSEGRLTNPPRYEAQIIEFEQTPILVITIEENAISQKPCYISNRSMNSGSFKRLWDKDVPLSSTELYEISNALIRTGSDRAPVAVLDDLDNDLIDDLLARMEHSRALRNTNGVEEKLRRLGILNSSGEVSLAGLLVLGKYPQQYYPKLTVDVAVFPDNEKSTPGKPRFVDRVICEGGLIEEINHAVGAVARNLRVMSIITGVGRRDEPEIPLDVLREAIANAVVHREYDARFLGQAVSVDVYPNRVEIRNPGGLWGGRTLENLADGISECRNDQLMSLVRNTPISGTEEKVVEGGGTGIPLMINRMKQLALRAPDFYAGLDYFRVTLGRYGTEIAENREWIKEVGGEGLGHDKEAMLLLAREKGAASIRDFHQALGIDSDEVRANISDLEKRSLVTRVGDESYSILDASASNAIARDETIALAETEKGILQCMTLGESLSSQELANRIGKSARTVQRNLVKLIDAGFVTPTASKASKDRKYLRLK